MNRVFSPRLSGVDAMPSVYIISALHQVQAYLPSHEYLGQRRLATVEVDHLFERVHPSMRSSAITPPKPILSKPEVRPDHKTNCLSRRYPTVTVGVVASVPELLTRKASSISHPMPHGFEGIRHHNPAKLLCPVVQKPNMYW